MLLRTFLFLILNFAALGLGSFFTSDGVQSDWYAQLNKAPWTPPGWFFGFAWTTIMICFAFYLAFLWKKAGNLQWVSALFGLQWVLNVMWNPLFFYLHWPLVALFEIVLLTFLVGTFLFKYYPVLNLKSVLLLPYVVWLLIATSLNGYVVLMN